MSILIDGIDMPNIGNHSLVIQPNGVTFFAGDGYERHHEVAGYAQQCNIQADEGLKIMAAIKILTSELGHLSHHLLERGKDPDYYAELGQLATAIEMGITALKKQLYGGIK